MSVWLQYYFLPALAIGGIVEAALFFLRKRLGRGWPYIVAAAAARALAWSPSVAGMGHGAAPFPLLVSLFFVVTADAQVLVWAGIPGLLIFLGSAALSVIFRQRARSVDGPRRV